MTDMRHQYTRAILVWLVTLIGLYIFQRVFAG